MAAHPTQHFSWTWNFAAPPEALWPLVSNTDRFNRDCGYPAVTVVPEPAGANTSGPPVRRLRARVAGVVIEWDELAFEWIAPRKFSVDRSYRRGPVARMVVHCEVTPAADGGSTLVYRMEVTPAWWLARLALPLAVGGHVRRVTARVFRRYDELARRQRSAAEFAPRAPFAPGGRDRQAAIARQLTSEAAQPAELVARLQEFITTADDLAVARIRPYVLADAWARDRREVLRLCLHATRAGLLDFSWDLLCPHCRGAKARTTALSGVRAQARCDSCQIDFTVNFDQSVELTFTPNSSVRPVPRVDYCIGGPQITPHIVAQQLLPPRGRAEVPLTLAPGRYRTRSAPVAVQPAFRVAPEGAPTTALRIGEAPDHEPVLAPRSVLVLENPTAEPHLTVVEHLAWGDQATTAADVTSLQLFRDLFSHEVLRPGEQINVGAMTIVFTDLKNSTQLYQEIGDAPAFGRVLTHFDVLRTAIAAEGGGIVKTMGDAVMAVFPRPLAALRAMVQAQAWLARPDRQSLPPGLVAPAAALQPLALKAGLHLGPCLAINQNERLDYFGTTVNTTARLCGLCTGTDLVLSRAVRCDPEVDAYLSFKETPLAAAPEQTALKGFGDQRFEVWRVTALGR